VEAGATGGPAVVRSGADFGPEAEAFRAEIRQWIAAQAPAELASLADWNAPSLGSMAHAHEAAAGEPAYRQWEDRLLQARLICPQWPSEAGGRGLSAVELAVFSEELYRARLPRVRRGMGESLVGPSVIVHGTDAQRARFLPRIISGQDVYCQGFSEPDHGSDLAGLTTKGEVDGDEIVITGQKVWTSRATDATMMFVLCRTDRSAARHAGLSYVLVPMPGNGIEISPIRDMSGADYFCQEYITGARAPLANVIGGLHNGWRVAMTTLGNERGGGATVQHLGYEREFWELVDLARKKGLTSDPVIRQRLALAYSEIEIIRYAGLRLLAAIASDQDPGPEASVAKLRWSEYHQRFTQLAIAIEGADAMIRPDGPGYATSRWQDTFLWARAGTIYSGTSEVQRRIIGERSLGLPREPSG
jgi:alkylation response protein AidB-like acyl-CoA dehydrogenase